MKNKPYVLYLSHGGGPLPLLGDEGHREMVSCLQEITAKMAKPSAILVVSAHWEEKIPTITSGVRPSLMYDYYGFPEESYSIEYPCPGEPLLAGQIHKVLVKAGIKTKLDNERGFDHGLFVSLKIMYPDADIPCVQLSLVNSLNPLEHIKIGQAFRGLRYDNLLIIGSGFSFHNLKAFFAPETRESKSQNESFEIGCQTPAPIKISKKRKGLIDLPVGKRRHLLAIATRERSICCHCTSAMALLAPIVLSILT